MDVERASRSENGCEPDGDELASEIASIRVVVQQPGLPRYRLPVFRELALRTGIQLKVVYGPGGSIPNADPESFEFEAEPGTRQSVRLGGRELWWSAPQWRYATRQRHDRPDVLILSWNLHYASLVPALLRARHHRIPTILWGHGYSKHDHPLRRWPREQVTRLASALLFYNHTMAERFIDAGYNPGKVFVALNALDQGPIQSAQAEWLAQPDELEAFRRQHGLDERQTLLFVSRLDPDNRLDLLLEAAARLVPGFPRLRVVIIGKGSDGPRLTALADRLGIAGHVLFPGAIYDETDLAPWFLSSRVFCYPANIGLSILHAFGYGLPVVSGDQRTSQNPEIEALEHGVNGLSFRDGDVTALCEALKYLLTDADLHQCLSAGARETVLTRFNLGNMVDGMVKAIRYCAAAR